MLLLARSHIQSRSRHAARPVPACCLPACQPAVLQVKLCATRNILLNWLDYGHGYGRGLWPGTQLWAALGGRVLLGRTTTTTDAANNEKQFSVCQSISCRPALPSCSTPLQRQLKCVNMADLGAELSVGTGSRRVRERDIHRS